MNCTNKLSLVVLTFIMMMLVLLPANSVLAQRPDLGLGYVNNGLDLADTDPREAVISLVALLMTFLGIIAVIIILYGGFVWLTAAGNEERVSKAKKIIVSAIIGLIIILASFLIINFVEQNVSNALN